MRYALAFGLGLMASPAAAMTLESMCVVGHGFSKHFAERNWPVPGADWQERNYGGGLCVSFSTPEWRWAKHVTFQAGAYRSSLSSNAFASRRWEWVKYGSVMVDFLDYRIGRTSLHLGPMVGVAFGYRNNPVIPIGGVQGEIRYRLTRNVSVGLLGGAHLTPGKSKGNVNVSAVLRWSF